MKLQRNNSCSLPGRSGFRLRTLAFAGLRAGQFGTVAYVTRLRLTATFTDFDALEGPYARPYRAALVKYEQWPPLVTKSGYFGSFTGIADTRFMQTFVEPCVIALGKQPDDPLFRSVDQLNFAFGMIIAGLKLPPGNWHDGRNRRRGKGSCYATIFFGCYCSCFTIIIHDRTAIFPSSTFVMLD